MKTELPVVTVKKGQIWKSKEGALYLVTSVKKTTCSIARCDENGNRYNKRSVTNSYFPTKYFRYDSVWRLFKDANNISDISFDI